MISKWRDTESDDDPFWVALSDNKILRKDFGRALKEHLDISRHPKADRLVEIAMGTTTNLNDAYLMALEIYELLEW